MKLIPYEDTLPREYLQHRLEILCDSGWEMSKRMHEIKNFCNSQTNNSTVVWTTLRYVITLWFQEATHKTWFELVI